MCRLWFLPTSRRCRKVLTFYDQGEESDRRRPTVLCRGSLVGSGLVRTPSGCLHGEVFHGMLVREETLRQTRHPDVTQLAWEPLEIALEERAEIPGGEKSVGLPAEAETPDKDTDQIAS